MAIPKLGFYHKSGAGLTLLITDPTVENASPRRPMNRALRFPSKNSTALRSDPLGFGEPADNIRQRLGPVPPRSMDAVRYEPVSGGNSLLTGKLTGNFAILGLRSQFRCTKPLCCSDFLRNSLRKLTGKIF